MDSLYGWLSQQENSLLLNQETIFTHNFSRQSKISKSLLIAHSSQAEIISQCQADHRYLLCNNIPSEHINQVALCICNLDELPIEESSIDMLVLAHSLEQQSNPQAFLSECSKLISPEGYILVFSLNPYSPIYYRKQNPTNIIHKANLQHWLSAKKIRKWLNASSCEILSTEYFISPCAFHETADKLFRNLLPMLCYAHCVVAQKKSLNMTPIYNKAIPSKRNFAAIKPMAKTTSNIFSDIRLAQKK